MKPFAHTFIVLFLIFLTPSCNTNNSLQFVDTVTMDNYLIDAIELDSCRSPMFIQVIDSLAFICDQNINEFIKIYKISNFEYLGGFVKTGKGPNEYLAPGLPSIDRRSNMVWFNDFAKTTLFGFSIKDILIRGSRVTPVNQIPFDQLLMPLTTFNILPDTSILASSSVDTSFFTILNNNGKMTRLNIKNPIYRDEFHSHFYMQHLYNQYYSRSSVYNDSLNISICAFSLHDCLVMSNLSTYETKTLLFSDIAESAPNIIDKNVVIDNVSYFCLKEDGGFVYGSYLGDKLYDENYSTNYPDRVHVFDWSLNPIAELIFTSPIVNFSVHENLIYVITTSDSPEVVVYKLPPFLSEK
jgi:hypothetical protein